MPPPSRRALVIVDMSVEQMASVTYNGEQIISNCKALALNPQNNAYFELVLDCRLWLHSPEESSLSWVWPDAGKTMFVANSEGANLIPQLRDLPNLAFVPKNNYSCFANSNLLSALQSKKITDVYICGINTDYCVFATAMDSFQYKFQTYVVTDAVTSVRGKAAHVQGLHNLQRHFGKQVLVTTKAITSPSKKHT